MALRNTLLATAAVLVASSAFATDAVKAEKAAPVAAEAQKADAKAPAAGKTEAKKEEAKH